MFLLLHSRLGAVVQVYQSRVHSWPKVLDAFGQIGNPEKFGNEIGHKLKSEDPEHPATVLSFESMTVYFTVMPFVFYYYVNFFLKIPSYL